ncbi:sugar phosphate isomerase/epimerase family protein [Carboxylicivirga linearis]|uniref:Sugar phosphate isomerase/epimerase n=1 Tax=Carboxylicivirga linearis TaxID=1628157 RepID=A0ABS5JTW0_9BACT|nr:sugar phosphate isomerase/epimerase [Carboxylicivirga linearis]MBS2098339.1 sugar phosphate isomerase/epimerase [Carboxylicivirga linearis]
MRSSILKVSIILFISSIIMSACSQVSKPKKDVGLQLWSVRDDMNKDAAATIQKVGEIGYTFIEAAGYDNGKFYGMSPAEFKALLDKNGLQFTASHAGHDLPDSSNWDETMAWWDECIDAHKAAGVEYIIQASMDEKGYGSLEDLKLYCDYFNAVGAKCKAKGLHFGYHNHDKEFEEVDGQIRYDFMLQNTDSDKVFFELDLYWIKVGGKSAVDYFEKYPGRFLFWHIKDKKELGASGTMDFASVFAKTDLAGMQKIVVEVENYNFEPLESVRLSYNYLNEADFVK